MLYGSPRRPSPIAERFWSLAEAAERGAVLDRTRPVGVVRHVLDILAALDAGGYGAEVAPTTRAFLADLADREAAGDVSYSAPERIVGLESGERALVYSIGVLLFEGLTGRHPLGAVEGPRRMSSLSSDAVTQMVRGSHEVPHALRDVIARAMGPDPRTRYASVAALRAELEWYVVAEEESGALVLSRGVTFAPLPSVVLDEGEDELPSHRTPSLELELETAVVPRFDEEELTPRRVPILGVDLSPRLAEPRRWLPRVAGLVAFGLGLAAASATLTALALRFARRG